MLGSQCWGDDGDVGVPLLTRSDVGVPIGYLGRWWMLGSLWGMGVPVGYWGLWWMLGPLLDIGVPIGYGGPY